MNFYSQYIVNSQSEFEQKLNLIFKRIFSSFELNEFLFQLTLNELFQIFKIHKTLWIREFNECMNFQFVDLNILTRTLSKTL